MSAKWKMSERTDSCVSLRPSTFDRSRGPKSDTVARSGTPVPIPPRDVNWTGQPRPVQSWPIASVRSVSLGFAWAAALMPVRSPLMSEAKTGTPARDSCSASTCRVTVLPVPVAPAMSPWRFIMPSGRRTGASGTGSVGVRATPTSIAGSSKA